MYEYTDNLLHINICKFVNGWKLVLYYSNNSFSLFPVPDVVPLQLERPVTPIDVRTYFMYPMHAINCLECFYFNEEKM